MQLTIQALALPIIVTAAVVYIALERRFPYARGQKILREGFWNDFVMYTIVQSLVLGQVIDHGHHDRRAGGQALIQPPKGIGGQAVEAF